MGFGGGGEKVGIEPSEADTLLLCGWAAAAGDGGDELAIAGVDGLAGATLTSNGVTNLIQFWLGENGFGPYLAKVKEQGV